MGEEKNHGKYAMSLSDGKTSAEVSDTATSTKPAIPIYIDHLMERAACFLYERK